MRPENIVSVVLIVLILGTSAYFEFHPKPQPVVEDNSTLASAPAESKFLRFCRRAQLVSSAVADCERMMAAAQSDEERLRIERMFAMGSVQVDSLDSASGPGGKP